MDARETPDSFISGAVHAPWKRFTAFQKQPSSKDWSVLYEALVLQEKLRALGVNNDVPVVVYGDWAAAWGEEGRLYWMLDYLNHTDVSVLYGGVDAWTQINGDFASNAASSSGGDFVARPVQGRRVTGEELKSSIDAKKPLVILDSREMAEYDGSQKKYGVSEYGHIPSAKHYYWKEVFDKDGVNLKEKSQLLADFAELGIKEDEPTPIVAYCTGGIRSGFLYLVMRQFPELHPANYDGSFWEWSASGYPTD